ncbi:DUF397 domain-containing protein [Streptomyces sp. NPDC007088]|uniref:DUF397 domain-containing protein n=1 Tax=Streptomyces sp. NPDC007088 TaxID=3364773 RepID=UPI00369CF13A
MSERTWRKSSYSGNNGGNCVEVADPISSGTVPVRDSKRADGPVPLIGATAYSRWIKSSHSGNNGGECLEIAPGVPGLVPVRDSKVRGGPILVVGTASFRAFVEYAKAE